MGISIIHAYVYPAGLGGVAVCSVPCYRMVAGSNLPQGRQWEATSLISSLCGVKANDPAFGQRTIVIICIQ